MNKQKLRAQMALHGDNNSTLAKALEISRKSMSEKINNKQTFKQGEMQKIIDRYNLTADDIQGIFFTQEVS